MLQEQYPKSRCPNAWLCQVAELLLKRGLRIDLRDTPIGYFGRSANPLIVRRSWSKVIWSNISPSGYQSERLLRQSICPTPIDISISPTGTFWQIAGAPVSAVYARNGLIGDLRRPELPAAKQPLTRTVARKLRGTPTTPTRTLSRHQAPPKRDGSPRMRPPGHLNLPLSTA